MTTVRDARLADVDDIVRLTGQLGYAVTASETAAKLSRILSRHDHRFFVAEAGGQIVGWLHAAVTETIEADPFVVVGGLVVDRDHRGQGVGRTLLEHAEAWPHNRDARSCVSGRARSARPRTSSTNTSATRRSRRSTRS